MFTTTFLTRSFDPLPPPRGRFRTLKASWRAMGGPHRATLAVESDPRGIASLASLLGLPLMLHAPDGSPHWWGYVHGIDVPDGIRCQRLGLDDLANRVAARYFQPDGVTRVLTPWVEDVASQERYGVREACLDLKVNDPVVALGLRDANLAARAWPGWLSGPGMAGKHSALLDCRGWYVTFAWRHYACDLGWLGNTGISGGTGEVGTWTFRKLAQSFCPQSAWLAETVRLRVRRTGDPGDALCIQVCMDAGGQPGTLLGQAQVDAGAIPAAGLAWLGFALDPPVALQQGVQYWLVLSRSGSPNNSAYFIADLDESLSYTEGVLRWWDGTTWRERSPDADLVFSLEGGMDTGAQMAAIVAACGQFLKGCRVEQPTGLATVPWRDGSGTALEELERLAGLGDGSGRRLRLRVDENRVLVLERVPQAGVDDWMVGVDGYYRDHLGVRQPNWVVPTGRWVRGAGWEHAPAQPVGGGERAAYIEEWKVDFP